MLLSWSYSVQRVILINVYSDHWQRTILKWQCHEILTIFLLKRFDLGPIWTGENGFVNFFVFTKIFFFRYRRFHILNYYYWVCKHPQYHFFLIVPLESVRSLQSVHVVLSVTASCWQGWHCVHIVLNMLTQCLHTCWPQTTSSPSCLRGQQLSRHRVCIVNDYDDIVSA